MNEIHLQHCVGNMNSNNNLVLGISVVLGLGVMVGFVYLFGGIEERMARKNQIVPPPIEDTLKGKNSLADIDPDSEPAPLPDQNQQALQLAADEVNRNCPMMIDAETRLDNAVALPGNIFQYNYTLINTQQNQVDVSYLKGYLHNSILNNIRTNPDLQGFRNMGTTLTYAYKDMEGNFLLKLSFGPQDYSN